MKSKEEFLLYKNPSVIRRYIKDCKSSQEEADIVWLELMKYMYLAAYCNHGKIFIELPFFSHVNDKIDEMWHRFLLFTVDYREFCNQYCGIFLDHVPEDDINEFQFPKDYSGQQINKENLKDYLRLIYQIWGKETLENWIINKIYKQ